MEPDYYEVLEVPGDATREEIKASYRRAVRQHHPDAAPPEAKETAHEKIQGIIAAWTVLGDPGSRLAYDERRRRVLAQASLKASGAHEREAGRTERRSSEPLDARKRNRVQAVMGGTSPPRPVNPRTRLLAMVFDAAQMYHVEGRPDEAARVCQQVLRADPTNAEAAVLLADIYAAQNRRAAALDLLERALRLQPANAMYRSKWEALRRASEGRSASQDTAPGVPPAVPRASAPNPWSKAGPQRPLTSRIAERAPGTVPHSDVAQPEPTEPTQESAGTPSEPQPATLRQTSDTQEPEQVGHAISLSAIERSPERSPEAPTVSSQPEHRGEAGSPSSESQTPRFSLLQRLRSKLSR